jgi:hypothetical protein
MADKTDLSWESNRDEATGGTMRWSQPQKWKGTKPEQKRFAPTSQQKSLPFFRQVQSAVTITPEAKIRQAQESLGREAINLQMDPGGVVIYQKLGDPTGQWYTTQPHTWGSFFKSLGADALAHLPAGMGAGTGALMSKNPLGAFFGAAGTELVQGPFNAYSAGEPYNFWATLPKAGMEGAYGLTGELGGRGIVKGIDWMRNVGRQSGSLRVAPRLDGPVDKDLITKRQKTQRLWGIPDSPITTYGGSKMGRDFYQLSQLDATSDITRKFHGALDDKSLKAAKDFLETLGPEGDTFKIAKKTTGAAKEFIENLDAGRTITADPFYEAAWEGAKPVETRDIVNLIDSMSSDKRIPANSKLSEKLQNIRKMLFNHQGELQTSAQSLNHVKMHLDEVAELTDPETLKTLGPGSQKWVIGSAKRIRNNLIDAIDEATDGRYRKALDTYAKASDPIDDASEGIIGYLASKYGSKRGMQRITAVRSMFNPRTSTPSQVAKTRFAITETAGEDAWLEAVKLHYIDALGKKLPGGQNKWNVGYKFFNEAWSTGNQKDIMEMALKGIVRQGPDGKYYDMFELASDMFDMFEQTGMAYLGQSSTQMYMANEAAREIQGSGIVKKIMKAAGDPARAPGHLFFDKLNLALTDQGRIKLAEAMTSPEVAAELKYIKSISPAGRQQAEAFTALLGVILGTSDVPSRVADYMQRRRLQPKQTTGAEDQIDQN